MPPTRKVEREYEQVRPRDEAIKRASESRTAGGKMGRKSITRPDSFNTTVDEEFNLSYQNAGIQPTYKVETDRSPETEGSQGNYKSRYSSDEEPLIDTSPNEAPVRPNPLLKKKYQREGVAEILKRTFPEHYEYFDEGEEELLVTEPVEKPRFPLLIVLAAASKDTLDILEFTIIGAILTVPLSLLLGLVLFIWCLGKISGGWWKKALIKWLWKRYVFTLIIEFIPLFKIIPATTIFVLMAHYREKKIVKIANLALEELKAAGFLKKIG